MSNLEAMDSTSFWDRKPALKFASKEPVESRQRKHSLPAYVSVSSHQIIANYTYSPTNWESQKSVMQNRNIKEIRVFE